MTRNQTKPLSLKRKHTRKNRHASGLNENGSKKIGKQGSLKFGLEGSNSVLNLISKGRTFHSFSAVHVKEQLPRVVVGDLGTLL